MGANLTDEVNNSLPGDGVAKVDVRDITRYGIIIHHGLIIRIFYVVDYIHIFCLWIMVVTQHLVHIFGFISLLGTWFYFLHLTWMDMTSFS